MRVTEVASVCIWRIVLSKGVAMSMKFYSGFL
jgi:hypothetical protein